LHRLNVDPQLTISIFTSRSLSTLVPRLYPYFRHTIGPVRLAVVRTIQAFLDDADLPNDWINADILHLLYKNLVVEDRIGCRTESLAAWNTALRVISVRPDFLSTDVLPNVAGWFNIALVPINMPLEPHLFCDVVARGSSTSHNVDKGILGADLALVSAETILRNRIDAITALAEVTRYDVSAVSLCRLAFTCVHAKPGLLSQATHQTLLSGYLASTSAHQLSMCSILIEEWTRVRDEDYSEHLASRLEVVLPSVEPLVGMLERLVELGPPAGLYEVQTSLQAIRQEAKMLANLIDRHRPESASTEDVYAMATLEQVQDLLDGGLDDSLARIPAVKRKQAKASVKDRRTTLATAISRHRIQQEQLEIQIQATAAAALIGMRFVPSKMNPLMKGIMSGVKVGLTI
jgi:TATA-binding protein-associated factor